MVMAGQSVQNASMSNEHGWVSYVGGGDNSHLSDEERKMVEERIRVRRERQGGLLAIVEIR
jgi:hypothetical protein